MSVLAPDQPTRETARAAARQVFAELNPGIGGQRFADRIAEIILDAVASTIRTAALAETEAMIRASCFTHTPGTEYGWPDCHCAVADHLRLAAAPATTTTPEEH
ncbi:hypothetical protein [Streptacidiphilus cavernicola]|uniref:Uncharacterized protein n=1 Tax=Streptacidiphilus cavernicola TaxID=3342716 RepID=A0ABV6W470_9ACTN